MEKKNKYSKRQLMGFITQHELEVKAGVAQQELGDSVF